MAIKNWQPGKTGTQQVRALTTPDKSSDVMVKPCSALIVVVNELDGEVNAYHGDECNPGERRTPQQIGQLS